MRLFDLWCETRPNLVKYVTRSWLQKLMNRATLVSSKHEIKQHFASPMERHPLHGHVLAEMQEHQSALIEQIECDLYLLAKQGNNEVPPKSALCDLNDVSWNNAWGAIGEIRAFGELASIPELAFRRNSEKIKSGGCPDFTLDDGCIFGEVKTITHNDLHVKLQNLYGQLYIAKQRRKDLPVKLTVYEKRGLLRKEHFEGLPRNDLEKIVAEIEKHLDSLNTNTVKTRIWKWCPMGDELLSIRISSGTGTTIGSTGTVIRNQRQRTRDKIAKFPKQLHPEKANIRIIVDRPLVTFATKHHLCDVLAGYYYHRPIKDSIEVTQEFQTGLWSSTDSDFQAIGRHVSAVLLLHLPGDGLLETLPGDLFMNWNPVCTLAPYIVTALEKIGKRFPCVERFPEQAALSSRTSE